VRTVPIRNPLQAPPRLELDPTNGNMSNEDFFSSSSSDSTQTNTITVASTQQPSQGNSVAQSPSREAGTEDEHDEDHLSLHQQPPPTHNKLLAVAEASNIGISTGTGLFHCQRKLDHLERALTVAMAFRYLPADRAKIKTTDGFTSTLLDQMIGTASKRAQDEISNIIIA
jgi:hypothetical protein